MFYCLSTLNFAQVGEKIKLKDYDAIKKWLISKNISIHKIGRFQFVYEIDVDCAIDTVKVLELKKQYPTDWVELYKRISVDKGVYELVIRNLKGIISANPTTKVKPVSESDYELYKKYSI
jgi:hypothetical protein